jgi:FkbM family methyltransferase
MPTMDQEAHPESPFTTFSYRGQPIRFPDLPQHVPRSIREQGTFYELDLLEHLERAVPHGGVWVDVGANIGNHTIFFSRYTAERVISLEPHRDNFTALEATIQANNATNVTPMLIGASDHQGDARMSLPERFTDNPGAYRVTPDGPVRIRVDCLDQVLADVGPVRLIKIDIEGHELPALNGARAILQRDQPHLAIEAQTKADLDALLTLLRPLGYRAVLRCGWTPTYHLAPWTWLQALPYRLRGGLRRLLD